MPQLLKISKMKKPNRPLGRYITEGTIGECSRCGSSLYMKYRFFSFFFFNFGKTKFCIHPKCTNYYKKHMSEI